jgi:hypothetical protein
MFLDDHLVCAFRLLSLTLKSCDYGRHLRALPCLMVASFGCAAMWCQLVVQLCGVSWLCSNVVSAGCAAMWCQLVVQLYGVR